MFQGCSSLKKLKFPKFNINKEKNISYLFAECSSLKELDISGVSEFYSEEKYLINGIFRGCKFLTNLICSNEEIKKLSELEIPKD